MDFAVESPLRVMSFCSGIGLLDRGVKLAFPLARTVCMVERESFPIFTLVQAMEEGTLDPCPIWTNLLTFRGRAWRGKVDLIAAGLPCQPYSLAGKGLGGEDDRALWPLARQAIDDVQPALVFLENVPGQLSRGFESIGEELQGLGYRFAAGLVRAKDVGAPHKRERLFVLAWRPELVADTLGLGLEQWRAARDLASPSGDIEGEGLQRQRGGGSAHDQGDRNNQGTVADADRGQGRPADRYPTQRGWPRDAQQAGLGGDENDAQSLVNPTSIRRREGWTQHELRGRGDSAACAGGAGQHQALGNTLGQGLQDGSSVTGGVRPERTTAERAGLSLPMWPPGPDALDDWRAILVDRPDLAPAIPALEPKVRGISDDGTRWDWLHRAHDQRIKRLSALGNGVVPQAAAFALSELWMQMVDSLLKDASHLVNYSEPVKSA